MPEDEPAVLGDAPHTSAGRCFVDRVQMDLLEVGAPIFGATRRKLAASRKAAPAPRPVTTGAASLHTKGEAQARRAAYAPCLSPPQQTGLCNIPPAGLLQLASAGTDVNTCAAHPCSHAPRPNRSATSADTAQNPRCRQTPRQHSSSPDARPSKKPWQIADSPLDFLNRLCILMYILSWGRMALAP